MSNLSFKTKSGVIVPAVSPTQLTTLYSQLFSELCILPAQASEAASYSMAMVVRYALGLSALDGRVLAIVADNLAGRIVCATIRHLVNAGANAELIVLKRSTNHDSSNREFARELAALRALNVEISDAELQAHAVKEWLANSHNLLLGIFDPDLEQNYFIPAPIIEVLNDASTPIHQVFCSPGVDAESGQATGTPLFASSTLSIGAPLTSLAINPDYFGRHYLADVSISRQSYESVGISATTLFSEQPVVQLLANTPQVAS